MDSPSYQRAAGLFKEALALSPACRDEYIHRAASGDAALAQRVRRMISYVENAAATEGLLPDAANDPASTANAQLVGSVIGPYRIVSMIGEGGFGVVYRAEQERPVRRTVAMKILKTSGTFGGGMGSQQVIARFEAERQALALMEHPGIARVIDAGQTDLAHGSRPYFVMELVSGEPITTYCTHHQLSLKARLDLFMTVCHAVQHAHQRGIIHRDLKPSNILVTEIDGVAAAKVIDFGIAKAISAGQRLTEAMLVTNRMELLGTPQYMSPEQADADERAIDTRSDVYSLGAVLYELLTGGTPLDAHTLRTATYSRMLQMILEQKVERPSSRLRWVESQPPPPEAQVPSRKVRGELDWITMKALEADRDRRYRSAAALAEDIGRYLNHQPVHAGPPSAAYRMTKFARRHRAAVIGVAAVIVVLIVGVAATVMALVRESKAADRSQQVAAFMEQMLSGIDPKVARGKDTELLRLIFEATASRIGRDLATQPEVEAEIRSTIGRAYLALGENEAARLHLEIAMNIRRRLLGNDHPDTLQSIGYMGAVLDKLGEFPKAEAYGLEALEGRRRVLGADHPDTLWSINEMCTQLSNQGRLQEAERYCRQAAEGRRRVLGKNHPETLASINNLGGALWDEGRFDEAEILYRESVEGHRRVAGEDHPNTLTSIANLGRLLRIQKKFDEAERYVMEALEGCRRVMGNDHPDTLTQINSLCALLFEEGKFAEAEPYCREVLTTRRKLLGNDHPDTLISINNMGSVLTTMGKISEAEPYCREAVEGTRRVMGMDHPDTLRAQHNMGALLKQQGDFTEAARWFNEALDGRRRALGAEHPDTVVSMGELASALLEMTPPDPERTKRALDLAEQVNTITGFRVPEYLDMLALAYSRDGDAEKAIEIQRQAIAALPPDAPTHAVYERRLVEYEGISGQSRPRTNEQPRTDSSAP
jgi:serine/threonine protein kinase/tetratricopeptide (TPR) repeat protein